MSGTSRYGNLLLDSNGNFVGYVDQFGNERGLPSQANRKLSRPAFKLSGMFNAPSAGTLGNTLSGAALIPFPFKAVYAHAMNIANVQIVNCLLSCGVSTSITDCVTPTSGLSPLLFSAAAPVTLPVATDSTTNNWIWSTMSSDRLQMNSVTRADGGAGYPFHWRMYQPGAGNTVGVRHADYATAAIPDLTQNRLRTFFRAGDCVTTPGNMTAANATEWQAAPPVFFEFETVSGQSVVLSIGDSTMQGQDGLVQINGPIRRASENLIGNGFPISFLNGSHSSMTALAYLTNGLALLDTYLPTVAAFCPFSPNGQAVVGASYTQADVDLAAKYMMTFLQECRLKRVIPILRTPNPVNSITAGQEAFRRQIAVDVRAACASGLAALIDSDALYTDYSTSTGGFKSVYVSASAVHSNEFGQSQEALLWAAVLANLVR
jgi:hypothetical protein